MLARVVGEPPAWAYADRSLSTFYFSCFFPRARSPGSLAWIRSARARVVLRTLCPAVENEFHRVCRVPGISRPAMHDSVRRVVGLTGSLKRICIYLYVSKTIVLAFSTNSRQQLTNQFIPRNLLKDQPRQYWIYANTDNELATVHIKVDCE